MMEVILITQLFIHSIIIILLIERRLFKKKYKIGSDVITIYVVFQVFMFIGYGLTWLFYNLAKARW